MAQAQRGSPPPLAAGADSMGQERPQPTTVGQAGHGNPTQAPGQKEGSCVPQDPYPPHHFLILSTWGKLEG